MGAGRDYTEGGELVQGGLSTQAGEELQLGPPLGTTKKQMGHSVPHTLLNAKDFVFYFERHTTPYFCHYI